MVQIPVYSDKHLLIKHLLYSSNWKACMFLCVHYNKSAHLWFAVGSVESVNTYSHLVSTAAMKNSKVFARTQEDFRHTVRERRNRTTFITGAQVKHADWMRCWAAVRTYLTSQEKCLGRSQKENETEITFMIIMSNDECLSHRKNEVRNNE